jgi:hypothetical protein
MLALRQAWKSSERLGGVISERFVWLFDMLRRRANGHGSQEAHLIVLVVACVLHCYRMWLFLH